MVQIAPPPGWRSAEVPSSVEAITVQPGDAGTPVTPHAIAPTTLAAWGLGTIAVLLIGAAAALLWKRAVEPDQRPSAVATTIPAQPASSETNAAAATEPEQVASRNDGPARDASSVEVNTDAQEATADLSSTGGEEPSKPGTEDPSAPIERIVDETEPTSTSTGPQLVESRSDRAPESPQSPAQGPVLKFDPLEFDPAQLSLSDTVGDGPTNMSEPSTSDGVPNINPDVEPVVEKPDLSASPPPLEPKDESLLPVRIGPASAGEAQPHNVGEQMALEVKSLEMPNASLAELVDTISQLSGVPITIDTAALAITGVTPGAPVHVDARDASLDRILRQALKVKRLGLVERDGRLTIVQPAADRRRVVDHEVGDLLESGAADATAIAELIRRIVVPESWENAGGTIRVDGTKLHIEQTSGVHAQILLFCERLRASRGLATRSRYPRELLETDSAAERLAAILDKQTTFTFLPWTRLADVVRHWQKSAGITVLVDWNALAREELVPSTPIACATIAKPWKEALDAVLSPIGLSWRIVDGQTIQITTPQALRELRQIEFYSLPSPLREQFASANALTADLERVLMDEADLAPSDATTPIHLEIDPASSRLMVLASPETHRYLTGRFRDSLSARRGERAELRTSAAPISSP
jgi:hypothetical protein